jgi:hypothetical protein
MSPSAIIEATRADGVILALSSLGEIEVTGKDAALDRWLPRIREKKLEIIAALTSERCDCPKDLESAIRRMAAFWEYSPDELAWALTRAVDDPEGWRKLVEFDAAWRGAR